MMAIYAITLVADGRRYIGSAVAYERRWRQHRHDLRHGQHANEKLQHAWNKYGESAFTFTLLEPVHERVDLLKREQSYLDAEFSAPRDTFNILAIAGSHMGATRSPEVRARISATLSGRKLPERSEEHRRNLGAALRGKIRTPEQRARMSAAKAGTIMSPEWCAKIADGNRGKTHTPEARLKMSKAAKTRHQRLTNQPTKE